MNSIVCAFIVLGIHIVDAQCWGPLQANRYLYQYPDGYSYRSNMNQATAQAECLTLPTCGGVTREPTGFWECRRGTTLMTSTSGEESSIRGPCGTCTNGQQNNNCNMKCSCYSGNWGCIDTCAAAFASPPCQFLPLAAPSYPDCCPILYCAKPECWGQQQVNTYLYQYPTTNYVPRKLSLQQAQAECLNIPACGGVTLARPPSTNAGYWESRKGPQLSPSSYGEISYQRTSNTGACGSASLLETATLSNQTTAIDLQILQAL